MEPVTVILLGEPVAASRPRFTRKGHAYNEPKKVNNTAALRIAAQQSMLQTGQGAFDEPLRMDIEVQCSIPESWSQRKRERALRGEVRPGTKPDLSNVIKQVEDAFNKVVYRDDSLIVEYGRARKVYSDHPKIMVTIQPIAPPYSNVIPGLAEMPRDTLDEMIDEAADV